MRPQGFEHIIGDMDIKELTKKMDDFVASKGWYAPDSPKQQTARNLAVSLAIESAEILEPYTCYN